MIKPSSNSPLIFRNAMLPRSFHCSPPPNQEILRPYIFRSSGLIAVANQRNGVVKAGRKVTGEKLDEYQLFKDDEKFMQQAMLEAHKAAKRGEVPVGAVMVLSGKIIARAHNRVERERDPTAHAEMLCIRDSARYLSSWRLLEATLYVTLEPCPMCAGAILQGRVGTLVWGATNSLLGADGSWISLLPQGHLHQEDDMQLRPLHPFHPNIIIRRNVLANQCSDIMRAFFQERRKKNAAMVEDVKFFPRLLNICCRLNARINAELKKIIC